MIFDIAWVERCLREKRTRLQGKLRSDASAASKRYALLVELPQIAAAFQRIHAGEYGLCIECGEQIHEKRLRAIPEVPNCQSCERTSRANERRIS